jgi:hypothetical protein
MPEKIRVPDTDAGEIQEDGNPKLHINGKIPIE